MTNPLLAPALAGFLGAYGLLIVLCACHGAGALVKNRKEYTMTTFRFLAHRIRRHGVTTALVLACLGLVLTSLAAFTPASSAPPATVTASPAAPSACAAYEVVPHGFSTPATTTCVTPASASVTPKSLYDCRLDHLAIYQDANYQGSILCFAAGDYNLTHFQFCAFWPFGCTTANDQLSSFVNDTAEWGYMTTDINGYGSVLSFSGYQATSYVGAWFNDQISFIHLS